MPTSSSTGATSRFRPEVWRIVTLLLLLLAIFGILQYSGHAWRVVALMHADGQGDHAPLTEMLAWDIVYLLAACVTVTAAAGTLMLRGWARPVLRVVAAALSVWLLVTAIMLVAHWSSFNNHSAAFLAQTRPGDAGRALIDHGQRTYLVAIILKAIGVPILVWLAWHLGVPAVRSQFARK